jgi:hypothetical protein
LVASECQSRTGKSKHHRNISRGGKEAISKKGANSEKQKRKFGHADFSIERDGLMVLSLGDSNLQTWILNLAP